MMDALGEESEVGHAMEQPTLNIIWWGGRSCDRGRRKAPHVCIGRFGSKLGRTL